MPSLTVPQDAITTAGTTDTFKWAARCLYRLFDQHRLISPEMVATACAGTVMSLSSSVSGIGTFDLGAAMASHETNDFMQTNVSPEVRPLKVVPMYSIEKSTKCQDEMIAAPFMGVACVFVNLLCRLHQVDRDSLLAPRGDHAHRAVMEIAKTRFQELMYCARQKSECRVRAADVTSAGSVCCDLSSYGIREGCDGPSYPL
jgi:hypothetical protein